MASMKRLRQWTLGVIVAIAAFTSIIGLQIPSSAQMPPELTLEAAGLTLEELAHGVYGLFASTDFPPDSPDVASGYPRNPSSRLENRRIIAIASR